MADASKLNRTIWLIGVCLMSAQLATFGDAQKTAQRWSSASSSRSSVARPMSVYGGYQATPEAEQQQQPEQQEQQQEQQQVEQQLPVSPMKQRQQSQTSQSSSWSSGKKQVYRPKPQPSVYQQQEESSSYESQSSSAAEAVAEPASYGSVDGQPGQDFPSYTRVPKTSFTCKGQPYDYGMYADEETGCQAYHLCYNGRKDSFLCGPGTVFNQRILHCDYWYSVDCSKSSLYYGSNAYMGSSNPEPRPVEAGERPPQETQQRASSYSRTSSRSGAPPRPEAGNIVDQSGSASNSFNQNVQQVQEAY